ncbi:MAG TPA: hypothetical protein PK812_12505, partial [Beijerinckiaceae bacterium]|nr:hypothetical protein [Beijerinckiaceae bacterium]
ANAAAARAQGRAPGWYALIPLAGPYMSTAGAPWRTREAEARVALEGQLAGLLFAGALYLLGVAFAAPMLHKAALIGFLFNLVQLVPLRPFDGGRLFPGLDWPATRDEDVSARLWLSLAFERLVRRIGCRIGLDDASRPAALRSLIGPALFTIMLAGFAAVAVVAVLLPPKAIALAILLWVAGTLALILFVLCLDPRVLRSGDERLLAPRRPLEPLPEVHRGPVPWSSRTKARCALLAYLLLLAAHALGALASWTA